MQDGILAHMQNITQAFRLNYRNKKVNIFGTYSYSNALNEATFQHQQNSFG